MKLHRSTTVAAAVAAVAVAVTTVAVGVGSATATATTTGTAGSSTTSDTRDDVVRLDDDASNGPGTLVPGHRSADLTGMRATYDGHRVRVTLQYAALVAPQGADDFAVHIVSLKTDRGRADVELLTSPDRSQGEQQWNGDTPRCRGLRTHVDYRAGRVRFVVPRGCLSDPAWVRVGGGDGMIEDGSVYADDVRRDGAVSENLVLGPRIHPSATS